MPEPIGYTPEPNPPLVPGPLNPIIAPIGPPEHLSLPAGHTSAFQAENYPPETAFFGHFGTVFFKRQDLRKLPIVYRDDQSAGLDTGVTPFGPLPVELRLNNVDLEYNYGLKATVGYIFGNQQIELTGFYSPNRSLSQTITNQPNLQGRLFVPFGPEGIFPLGFEGDNGLWNQADLVTVTYTSALGSAELNYQVWDGAVNTGHLIVGTRYLYIQDRVNIFTDDDYYVRDVFNRSDPIRQASYSAAVRNNIVAMQVGGEWSTPLPHYKLGWIWLSLMAKTGLGVDWIERTRRLERGDGFPGFDLTQNSVRLAGFGDVSAFVDFHLMERIRLRTGYTALYVVGVSTAVNQIEFDLTNQQRRYTDRRGVLWHGPMAELQFLF